MRRVFVPEGCITRDRVRLRGSEAHYLLHVLRLRPGSQFLALLPTGTECVATIDRVMEDEVEAKLGREQVPVGNPRCDVRIRPALTKARKMDLVIQKCTELGASEIGPVISERSIARPDVEQTVHKLERWQRIAAEAARQSGRTIAPRVSKPVTLDEALGEICNLRGTGIILVPEARHAAGPAHPILQPSDSAPISVLIGPEGGFTAGEVRRAEQAGLRAVCLGARTLRAETAAIVVCALLMYELGELA